MKPETSFSALARSAFEPLSVLGFATAAADPRRVRLENGIVALDVNYGRSSYAIDMTVSRLGSNERFGLDDVLAVFAPERRDLGRLQVPDLEAIPHFLTAIVDALVQHCAALLRGDPEAFAVVAASAAESRRATTLAAQYGAVIDRADQAWLAQDRTGAAELYGAAEPALDETRRRRLQFIRRSGSS